MRAKPTLKANWDNGEGDIGNLDNFKHDNDVVMRADLLQDWIAILTTEYNETLKELRYENV